MSNYPPNPLPYQPQQLSAVPLPVLKGPREFSIFGAMIRVPFFNGNVSRDVARNWTGIGFWYLFLLLLISWTLIVVKVHFAVDTFAQIEFPQLVKNIPPITIRDGHVTSPVEQPYVIKDPKGGKTIAVIDTTGEVNSLDDTDAMILITDHQIWSRQNNSVKQFDLSKIKYFYIDNARITGWMDTFARWVSIALLPLALTGALCWRLVQALIYGAIALGFCRSFGVNLNYAAAFRLAVVSVTPIILLDTLLRLGGWSIPLWWLIGLGISIFYIAMAVKANGSQNQPTMQDGNYAAS